MPEVWKGERLSKGTMFLLMVMSAFTRVFSTSLPVISGNLLRRSMSMQWLSVPPETMAYPSSVKRLAMAAALAFTCFW